MIQSIERDRHLDTLLNTLEVERYVRAPLLLEVLDILGESKEDAAELARRMLDELATGNVRDEEFRGELEQLRGLVHAVRPTPTDGVKPARARFASGSADRAA
jgi:hypothetical protein